MLFLESLWTVLNVVLTSQRTRVTKALRCLLKVTQNIGHTSGSTVLYVFSCAPSLGGIINTHHCHVVQHAAVHSTLIELGFVLWEANIIQPS